MAELWMPGVIQNRAPTRLWGRAVAPSDIQAGCLHTTESGPVFYPRPSDYYGHPNYPHFTVGANGIFQHIPVGRSARALRNLSGGVETNSTGIVQIEVCWKAADMPNLPHDIWTRVLDVIAWTNQSTGVTANYARFHPYPPPMRLGTEPYRLNGIQFLAFRGWLGHQHVPENTHGDPGFIPAEWFDPVRVLPPRPTPPPDEEEDPMAVPWLFYGEEGSKTQWVVTPDGTARFYGPEAIKALVEEGRISSSPVVLPKGAAEHFRAGNK